MDTLTGTQTKFGFRGDGFTRTCWSFRYAKLLFSYIFVKNISRSSDTCFRKIFRGSRTMLRLRRAAYKFGTLWTQGLKLSSVFEGMHLLGLVNDNPNSCFRKIFRGPRTMLRLRRAAYKLELYGHRDSKRSSGFKRMVSLGLVEVLDTPNSCFRIFSLKIFRGSRTHVFVKYFAVLGLCCACGGPLTNWNSVDTETQT